jgi:hypothetical protein
MLPPSGVDGVPRQAGAMLLRPPLPPRLRLHKSRWQVEKGRGQAAVYQSTCRLRSLALRRCDILGQSCSRWGECHQPASARVLLQNVLPQNVLVFKTSFLQNVLPQNVLPQNVPSTKRPWIQNVLVYKTSRPQNVLPSKRPDLQNVLAFKTSFHKTSFPLSVHKTSFFNLTESNSMQMRMRCSTLQANIKKLYIVNQAILAWSVNILCRKMKLRADQANIA